MVYLKKDEQMRIMLGTLLMFSANLNIAVKKTPKSDFGWTIHPQILFNTKNRQDYKKAIDNLLYYFRINTGERSTTNNIIISSYRNLKKLADQMDILDREVSGMFSRRFQKEWGAFLVILEMYGNEEHFEKEKFFEILKIRTTFMPKALTYEKFLKRNFGE